MALKATVVLVTSPAAGDDSGHYFAENAAVGSRPRSVDLVLPDLSLTLKSDRGVFSSDRLDPGTRLLLLEMPSVEPRERTILDLGCGWGPIACVAARRAPHATVWAIDVNRRARELTADNAESVGVDVMVASPSDVPDWVRFDRILSNPPIRIGKSVLHDLLAHWLDRLQPGGRAHLVVQRHLGSDSLARWLVTRGHPVERVASRWGYRLLEVGPNTAERS